MCVFPILHDPPKHSLGSDTPHRHTGLRKVLDTDTIAPNPHIAILSRRSPVTVGEHTYTLRVLIRAAKEERHKRTKEKTEINRVEQPA